MDQRERYSNPEEIYRIVTDALQARLWTALPAIIESYDASAMTCTAVPAVMPRLQSKDGSWSDVEISLLLDVPVHFPAGGGYMLTFPIQQGDEALVVFSSRCIDGWWETGKPAPQAVVRFHSLSDGFAIPKVWSKTSAAALGRAPSTDSVELRDDSGNAYFRLKNGAMTLKAPAGITLEGNVKINGTTEGSGTAKFNNVVSDTHQHTSSTPGNPTSPPIPTP